MKKLQLALILVFLMTGSSGCKEPSISLPGKCNYYPEQCDLSQELYQDLVLCVDQKLDSQCTRNVILQHCQGAFNLMYN